MNFSLNNFSISNINQTNSVLLILVRIKFMWSTSIRIVTNKTRATLSVAAYARHIYFQLESVV